MKTRSGGLRVEGEVTPLISAGSSRAVSKPLIISKVSSVTSKLSKQPASASVVASICVTKACELQKIASLSVPHKGQGK